MRIRVADKNVGEVIVNSKAEIGKIEEYAIKSLCMLQIMCLSPNRADPKFSQFIDILKETTGKLNRLYNGTEDENNIDPFEQFNDNNI